MSGSAGPGCEGGGVGSVGRQGWVVVGVVGLCVGGERGRGSGWVGG